MDPKRLGKSVRKRGASPVGEPVFGLGSGVKHMHGLLHAELIQVIVKNALDHKITPRVVLEYRLLSQVYTFTTDLYMGIEIRGLFFLKVETLGRILKILVRLI